MHINKTRPYEIPYLAKVQLFVFVLGDRTVEIWEWRSTRDQIWWRKAVRHRRGASAGFRRLSYVRRRRRRKRCPEPIASPPRTGIFSRRISILSLSCLLGAKPVLNWIYFYFQFQILEIFLKKKKNYKWGYVYSL